MQFSQINVQQPKEFVDRAAEMETRSTLVNDNSATQNASDIICVPK